MSLPSEISDLAKQLQAKLGEALPAGSLFNFEIRNATFSFGGCVRVGDRYDDFLGGQQVSHDPAALVAEAMERAKGAGK